MLPVCFSGEQNHKEQKKQSHITSQGKASSNKQIPHTKMKTRKSGDRGSEVLPGRWGGSGIAGPHSARHEAHLWSDFSAVVLNGKGEHTKLGHSVRNNYTDPVVIHLLKCCMFSSGSNMSTA